MKPTQVKSFAQGCAAGNDLNPSNLTPACALKQDLEKGKIRDEEGLVSSRYTKDFQE